MAIINFIGWETGVTAGDGSPWEEYSRVGTSIVDSINKHTGNYSLKVNPINTDNGYAQIAMYSATGERSLFNLSTIYVRFYFYITMLPALNSEEIFVSGDDSETRKLSIRINSTGNLMVFDKTGTNQLGSNGGTVFNTGIWYRIDVKVGTGASASYEVKINGITELSGTGDLNTNNNARIYVGKFGNINNQSVDFNYDDVLIDDADWPGVGRCRAMLCEGNGTYGDWTVGAGAGDEWQQIDEVPHDGDTTYLLSTITIGQAYTAILQSAADAGISGNILSVKSCGTFKRNTSTLEVDLRLRSGTTDSDVQNFNAVASYAAIFKIYNVDPNTGSAWTLSALDALEVGGVSSSASFQVRATQFLVLVEYIPLNNYSFGTIV